MIWKCGPKQRRIAHSKGIYSWKDPKCTPEALGIGGKYTQTIVSRILEANHSKDQNIFPQYISNNFGNWKNRNRLELFVDFEMTCSVFTDFEDLPNSSGESIIFTIGVGYIHPVDHEWVFKDFTLDRLNSDGEFSICVDFVYYIDNLMFMYKSFEQPAIYHWSHAEPSAWKRAITRHLPASYNWDNLNWVDLLKVFQSEPIGIKGCLNYGLKNVAKTFHKYGYIKSIWDSGNSCADGADAAVGAYKIDKETRKLGISFKSAPLAKEIIKYNEIDCKVLQEIIQHLRKNHIHPEDSDIEDYGLDIIEYDIDMDSFDDNENSDSFDSFDSFDSTENSESFGTKIIKNEK